MAPFKLKFRMGSSRSTSQEVDPDPQVNEALLNNHSTAIGASSSTIDSADCTSLGSMGTNERKSLLPNKSNNLRLGYLNPSIKQCTSDSNSSSSSSPVPKSPPPSYEHVLEENTRLANSFDLGSHLTLSNEDGSGGAQHSNEQYHPLLQNSAKVNSSKSLRSISSHLSSCERISLSNQCTDPDCTEANVDHHRDSRSPQEHHQSKHEEQHDENENNNHDANDYEEDDEEQDDNRKESIDSREFLISSKMTAPSSEENLLDNCNGDCQHGQDSCTSGRGSSGSNNTGFCDPLMNQEGYCTNELCSEDHYNNDGSHHDLSHNQPPPEYSENANRQNHGQTSDTDSDDGWDSNQMSRMSSSYQQQSQHDRSISPEIISNKSSKEIYKDLAKQWGITCKMSDQCRCMECQSHYFDCEYDDNEHQKSDGGLGAGTPMFISEVMHGSACTIL